MNKTKRKIFETSMKLFAQKGYDATSIEEITATVGVAKGTLYYHFSSKEEIFNFLIEEGIKLLKDCEKEKQELLNIGVADLKYSKHTINLSKLVYIFLALAILVNFLPVNGTVKLATNIIFLITAVVSLAKQIYESRF